MSEQERVYIEACHGQVQALRKALEQAEMNLRAALAQLAEADEMPRPAA
jgi:hypothetical protein